MPIFVVNPGRPDEKRFALEEGAVVIGRAPECDVSLVHQSLSRQHARLEGRQGRISIVDLGSKNGVHVNGVRVEASPLSPGDSVRMGDVTLAFVAETRISDPGSTSPPPPPVRREDTKSTVRDVVGAGIAHELRNPLSFVNHFAGLSSALAEEAFAALRTYRETGDPEALASVEEAMGTLRDNMAKIVEHGRRATTIITGMLHMARGMASTWEAADLNALVADSLALAAPRGAAQVLDVDIEASYDAAVGMVEIIRTDLSRVFLNLFENAYDAMRRKRAEQGEGYRPRLTVRTVSSGDHAEVYVRDNGSGIPRELTDKIFQPFFTTKPSGEGTGLGLSLSRTIVVQGHHGRMHVESELGQYTEFVVTIPKRVRPDGVSR
jgi:signal transduction histidine kinase